MTVITMTLLKGNCILISFFTFDKSINSSSMEKGADAPLPCFSLQNTKSSSKKLSFRPRLALATQPQTSMPCSSLNSILSEVDT